MQVFLSLSLQEFRELQSWILRSRSVQFASQGSRGRKATQTGAAIAAMTIFDVLANRAWNRNPNSDPTVVSQGPKPERQRFFGFSKMLRRKSKGDRGESEGLNIDVPEDNDGDGVAGGPSVTVSLDESSQPQRKSQVGKARQSMAQDRGYAAKRSTKVKKARMLF